MHFSELNVYLNGQMGWYNVFVLILAALLFFCAWPDILDLSMLHHIQHNVLDNYKISDLCNLLFERNINSIMHWHMRFVIQFNKLSQIRPEAISLCPKSLHNQCEFVITKHSNTTLQDVHTSTVTFVHVEIWMTYHNENHHLILWFQIVHMTIHQISITEPWCKTSCTYI